MDRFHGKVTLITGSSGIAAATARRIAGEGGSVCIVGIEADAVAALSDELGGEAAGVIGVAADVRDGDQTDAAFATCLKRLGRLDAVVAAAGGSGRRFGDGPVHELTPDAWDATLRLNATPVMTTCGSAVRSMGDSGGAIVVVSSVLAMAPSAPRFETHAYAAAKGAAVALVRAMAASYAARSIRVNAVSPGVTDTPMAARAASDAELQSYIRAKQPLTDGMVRPEAVAAAIAFLASPDADAITGQVVAVDGGWTVSGG